MKIPQRRLPRLRLAFLVAFTAASAAIFGFLWVNSGGKVPGVTAAGYRISVPVADVNNLVYFSDVRMAGVPIGKVAEIRPGPPAANVVLELNPAAAPLHSGATLRIGSKTLVEESYVDLVDGNGPPLRAGATLPASAVQPGVQIDDVVQSLDQPTRDSLGSSLRSLGTGTAGTSRDLTRLMGGLGELGRSGRTVLDALAAQSPDITELSRNTTATLTALDAQQGQIASLVGSAEQLTQATAAGRGELEDSMRQLPEVLASAQRGTASVAELSGALRPVAGNLNRAAPQLNEALTRLPGLSHDMRALLPPLRDVLDRAPTTLTRVPTFGRDTRALTPPARDALAEVNPALSFLIPYGRDIAAFFTNWGAQLGDGNADGNWARLRIVENEQALRNIPVNTNLGPLNKYNPYPLPGQSANPGPFVGPYPHVKRDGG